MQFNSKYFLFRHYKKVTFLLSICQIYISDSYLKLFTFMIASFVLVAIQLGFPVFCNALQFIILAHYVHYLVSGFANPQSIS